MIHIGDILCLFRHMECIMIVHITTQEKKINEPAKAEQTKRQKVEDAGKDFSDIEAMESSPSQKEP